LEPRGSIGQGLFEPFDHHPSSLTDCARVLQQTLDEEKATDQKLTAIAESKINPKAA
jgi:hypothetical protein